MSYQYHLVSNIKSPNLFKEVVAAIRSSSAYNEMSMKDDLACFKHKNSESKWGADIEVYFDEKMVFLDVHAGNAKRLVNYVTEYLENIKIFIEVDEL